MEKIDLSPLEWKKKALYDATMQLQTIKAMWTTVDAWLKQGEKKVAELETDVRVLEDAELAQTV